MLALLSLLPVLALVSASPIEKRYNGVKIVAGRDGKCLAAEPKTGSGSAVKSVDCNNSNWPMKWDINPGSGSVILSGTNLALDAGSNPGNNGALKVWQSYPGLYQQTWYLTDDERIAITGGNQCLDEGDNGIQTYQCTTGNTNQVFHVGKNGGGPSSSSSQAPSSTSSMPPASSSPSSTGYYQIHPQGQPDKCLTVAGGYDANGAIVGIAGCFTDEFAKFQQWKLPAKGSHGHVQVKGYNGLCLDAGENPGDGSTVKTWQCYDGLQQQDWTWSGSVFTLNNAQALDVRKESGQQCQKPYCIDKTTQTWQVSNNNDPYQAFTVTAV